MRGQGEIFTFILLSTIGIVLFVTATFWSRNIFQQNVDVAKVESAEKFMKDLDENINNVIKFGGSREMRYTLNGPISLVDSRTIETKIPISISLAKQWVNISSDGSYIQEKLDGSNFRIQLIYPQSDYRVDFFTDNSTLSTPSYVYIEKNQTITSGLTVIRIKITFS
jgi:hypothetical protein